MKLIMSWKWPDMGVKKESTEDTVKKILSNKNNHFINEQGKMNVVGFSKVAYETKSLYAGLMAMSKIQLELWRFGVIWFSQETDQKDEISQLLSKVDELENAVRSALSTINRWEKYKEGNQNDYFQAVKGILERALGFPMPKLPFI
ncbi:MAG: hypothetical protein Q7S12_04245 [bacterium]|nr:hypothetical protein [bacterium]